MTREEKVGTLEPAVCDKVLTVVRPDKKRLARPRGFPPQITCSFLFRFDQMRGLTKRNWSLADASPGENDVSAGHRYIQDARHASATARGSPE